MLLSSFYIDLDYEQSLFFGPRFSRLAASSLNARACVHSPY